MDQMTRRSLPAVLVSSPSSLAFRLRNAFRVRLLERYAAEGLRPTQAAILLALGVDPPFTQKLLIEQMGIDPSDTVWLLDELEQQGLVQRVPDPADRRRNLVLPTPAGRMKAATCEAHIARTEDEVLQPLAPEDRTTLERLLAVVVSDADNRMTPAQVRAAYRSSTVK